LRRNARIALATALVAAAAFPATPASAAQNVGDGKPEKACVTSNGRPIARMALNVPGQKKRSRKCTRRSSTSGRKSVRAHVRPRFQRLPQRYDDAASTGTPVARAAR
jgi:hypothetical protein